MPPPRAVDDFPMIRARMGGVGGSAVHIAPAAVAGKVIVADIDAQKARIPARWALSRRSTTPRPTPSNR